MLKSPFKFLDSYTKEDLDIFFGRDREINELYSAVFADKILLVYGVSGSGKSSLLNCGLANKFNDTDWLPVNVRRGSDINQSLVGGLARTAIVKSPFEKTDSEGKRNISITKALQSVYLDHFRPVYLIFDQFEELFIFGSREEKEEFIRNLRKIIDSDIQCRIILSIREEYLAAITEFEKVIPLIMSNRIRIEKMTRQNAIQAIEGPCRVNSIRVDKGFAEALLDKLNPGSPDIELTYMQVFLDRIWKEATREKREEISFTHEILERQGDVKDLLGSFLDEQISALDDPETGLTVLKSFVSVKGTRHHITEEEAAEYARTLGKNIDPDALRGLIRKFIALRILRDKDENGKYELRHDSLAAKIYEEITLVEKELLEIRQFIDNAWNNYEKRGVLLSSEDIKYIAPYADKLFLNERLQEFVDRSRKEIMRAKRRRQNILIAAALLIIAGLTFFTIWAQRERKYALEQQDIAEAQRNEAFKARAVADSATQEAIRLKDQAEENLLKALVARQEAFKATMNAEAERFNALREKERAEDLSIEAKQQAENAEREKQTSIEQRIIAENAEKETRRLNMLAIAQNIALKSTMLESNPELMGLLAVQAFTYNISNGGESDDPIIYNSLNRSYSILDGNRHSVFSGLPSECKTLTEIDNILISADLEGTMRLWMEDGTSRISDRLKYESPVSFLDFSGKNHLLTFHGNNKLLLWNIGIDGKLNSNYKEFSGQNSDLRAASISPDDSKLAAAGSDSIILIWDTRSDDTSPLQTLKTPSPVRDIMFCGPDTLISAQEDGSILLWQTGMNIQKSLLPSGNALPLCLAWNPEKRTLVVGCSDGTIRAYVLKNKRIFIEQYAIHTSGIDQIVFNRDYSLMATSSWDRAVKFYNYQSFTEFGGRVLTAGNMDSRVRALIFTSDNRLVASMSDLTIRLWETSSQNLADKICSLVTRNMTDFQWDIWIGEDIPYESTCIKTPAP